MTNINLDQANAIVAGARAKGRALGLKPLTIAVLDAGGHLVAFQREDQSSTLRPQVAIGKASSSLALGISSRKIGEMAAERPTFVVALAGIAREGLVPAAGGVLVIGQDGSPAGAVGVTGDSSDNDEICALAGIEAADLATSN